MARVEFKRALIATVLASLLALPALAQQPAAPPAAAPAAAPAAPPPAAPAAAPPPVAKPAQPPLPAEVLEPVSRLSKSIESAEKSIQQLKELEGELARLRSDVERIIYDSTSTAETLRPQLATVKDQIEKLGPPPSKDQPPETETVAAERARLNAQVGALDSAIKTTELAWVRAKQLIDRITVIRYQMFTKNLLERRDSPALPGLWRDVGSRLESIAGRVQYYGGDWVNWVKRKSGQVWAYALAILAGFAIATWLVHRVVQPRLVRPPGPRSPSFFQRVAQAAWIAPLRMAPAAAAVIAAYAALDNLDLLFSPWEGTANALLSGLLVFIAASTLVGTAFAPRHPAWRLIPVADATASRLVLILNAFLAVYVLDTVLVEFSRAIYVPLVVTVAQSFLMSVLFTGLLVYMLLTRFEQQIGPDRPVNGHEFVPGRVTRFTPYWVKFPLWGLAAAILLTSLAGYVALGRFIAHQLVLSGMVIAAAGLLYLAITIPLTRLVAVLERRNKQSR